MDRNIICIINTEKHHVMDSRLYPELISWYIDQMSVLRDSHNLLINNRMSNAFVVIGLNRYRDWFLHTHSTPK